MPAPTIAEYLKFANLQMAAEALYDSNATPRGTNLLPGKRYVGAIDPVMLRQGNLHASKFGATEATKFAGLWEIVEHVSNTSTGFSGTLFKAKETRAELGITVNELVLSFRSTEFVDDAARDNEATNKLEIKDKGFAFGQLDDMEKWYADLSKPGGPLAGKTVSVTGYSLGSHLATAFNLMHPGVATQVINFNGAGLGRIGDGSRATMQSQLPLMIAFFRTLRNEAATPAALESRLASAAGKTAYRNLKAALAPTGVAPDTATSLLALLEAMPQTDAAQRDDHALLEAAIKAAVQVTAKAHSVGLLNSGSTAVPPNPATIPDFAPDGSLAIAAESLDYQLAAFLTQKRYNTRPLPDDKSLSAARGTRFVAQGGSLANQWDLAGTETTTDPWYMVAYSQYRYGKDVRVFIEDQPFARGNAVSETVKKFMAGQIELLQDNYVQNDFGDTHSLVLIVDSLNVQNTLLQLVPEAQRSAAGKTLDTLLKSASWRKAEKDSGQGKAEGDVLENVVNALADLCLGPQTPAARLNGSPDGNTWWSTTNLASGTYTGRDAFYAKLKAITDSATYKTLQGKVEIVATSTAVGASARDDFGRLLALNDLAPFALKLTDTTALAALKSANETLAQDWEADAALTAAQRAGGLANFSNDWLADRANFLDRKNWFNAQNKNPVDPTVTPSMLNHRFQNPSITFKDVDSGYEIAQGVITDATKRMYFGGAENDALSGGRDADHLYGGGGADTLTGGAGRDRLEGGADDDRLEGGKDNDILLGGLGNDSYIFTSGDGWDWIDDRDGQGALQYDGKLLGSAAAPIQKIAANTWQSHNGQITYSLYDWNEQTEHFPVLSISGGNSSGGGLWIKRWQAGQFGITLPGALAPVPVLPPGPTTPVTKTTGWYDHDHAVLYGGLPAVELTALGDYGEVWGSGRLLGNASDNYLHNGEGDDELSGFGGKDTLVATGGNDKLYGGDGNDALQAGDGNDLLEGDEGSDVLAGGRGEDVLDGGAGDDFLMGGSSYTALRYDWSVERLAGQARFNQFGGVADLAGDGSDLLRGGAGNDWLWDGEGDDLLDGGEDSDQLVGGAGADKLLGGAGDDQLSGDGAQSSSPAYYTDAQYHGNDYLDAGAGNDTLSGDGGSDELYGGDGDDTLIGDADGIPNEFQGADYLDGEDGNDTLYGDGKDDTLFGGAGNDTLEGDASSVAYADHGDDYLDGEDGIDILKGDGGSDILFGGAGSDQLFGDTDDTPLAYQGADTLDGEDGDDYLRGYGGNDTLIGGAGGDQLLAEAGNDSLSGGAGDDLLDAGDGNDTVDGGGGLDRMEGGAGDDLYAFGAGDGPRAEGIADGIADTAGKDTLRFGTGIALAGITASRANADDLLLDIGVDRLLIEHGLAGAIERFELDDGTAYAYNEFVGRTLRTPQVITTTAAEATLLGGSADDSLTSSGGRARVSGGPGNDVLRVTGGGNTLLYALGDGTDRVSTGGAGNVLRLGAGITAADLKLGLGSLALRVGEDAHDVIHFENFTPINVLAQRPFDSVEFDDGAVLSYAELLARGFDIDGSENNDTLSGTNIADRLSGGAGNDSLSGLAGDDTLDGGAGYDTLTGGAGNDTYRFGRGAGQDLIQESDTTPGNIDTVDFAADVLPADVTVTRNINHLYLTLNATGDRLTVVNNFVADANKIEQVRFADGTVWDSATLIARTLIATAGADTLIGGVDGDVLDGLGGDDAIDGQGGNDLLSGGAGNDTVTGGTGDDTLDGGAGDDSLYGGTGSDSLDGGAGNDFLEGDAGNDSYRFGRGAGQDRINDTDATPGNLDTVVVDADVLPADVSVTRDSIDLYLAIKGTADKLRVLSYFVDPAYQVEQVRFAGGTVWDAATLLAKTLTATEGPDTLFGGAGPDVIDGLGGDDTIDGQGGNDTLAGGAGNDTLTGGTGSDTYLFGRGSGADTLVETSALAGDIDTLQFGAGIAPGDIIVNRVSVGSGYPGFPNLRFDIKQADGTVSPDSVVLKNFFVSQDASTRIEQVRFAGGTIWDTASFNATIASGTELADTFLGDGLNDNFDGRGGNDELWGYGGNDILSGGVGNDTLYGGLGNDTYRFGRGDGADTVNEASQGGGTDTLELGAGILAADVSLYANDLYANDGRLVVVLDNSSTQLAVSGFFSGGTGQIERILFADASQWDLAAINSRVIRGTPNAMIGTPGNDVFVVDDYGDTITEAANQGTDTVQSRVGWTLGANLENLTLTGPLNVWGTGNALNNIITGNTGNNVLNGLGGYDTLMGGKGDDTYLVSAYGEDTVTELAGEGIDKVIVTDGASYTLPANVENLTMNSGYAGRVTSTGNALDNVITGRYGTTGDTLDGAGGNDTLIGSVGDDIYRFTVGGGADTIVESGGVDQLVLGAGIPASAVTASRSGSQVKLSVSPTDSVSFAETVPGQYAIEKVVFEGEGLVWQASDIRRKVNSAPTGVVTLSGGAAEGETLTAASSLADADGLGAIYYQWQFSTDGTSWNPIAGATASSLLLTEAQVGKQVRVNASYTDGHGTLESMDSLATAAITSANGNSPPTGAVTLGGTATQNQTLTATNTLADVDGLGAIGYQWQSSADAGVTWNNIGGATASSLTLTEAQVGKLVRVNASYIDGHATAESKASAATAAIANANDAPTGAVTVTGTATQNQILAATNTLADLDGLGAIGYQWQSSADAGVSWGNISGATAGSFTLTETQVGKLVRVTASYIDGHGTAENKASAATTAIANVNDAPTGTVTVTGTATQNQILTAANTLADADGLGAIGYQWQSSADAGVTWNNIGGATASSFTLSEAQVGKLVRVTASYIDGHGTAESKASAATTAIGNVNDAPTGAVTVTGTATQNQILTATNTLADLDGLGAIGYQWQSSADAGVTWNNIAGATASSFTLTEAQVGKLVRVTASYIDGHGAAETKASAATTAIANVNDAPTGAVTVSGTATQNQILTAANTLADLDGLGAIGYQWQSSADAGVTWNNIAGATASSFTLTEAQVGKLVRVTASYIDGHGAAETKASAATTAIANVNDAPTGAVTVSGTATQNQILTAANTLADLDGLGAIGYQWQSSADAGVTWNNIAGVTASSFTLTETQVGKLVRVTASYVDGHGTAENKASAATTAIANINDAPTGTVTVTGTATQNQILTATNTLADLDGLGAIGYQWQSSADSGVTWNNIGGATASTFTLTASQVGQQVRAVASYTDGHGTVESKASGPTAAIVASVNSAPTGTVTVTGTATQNQSLTAANTLADADGLGAIGYQWQSSADSGVTWSNIGGATASSFRLTEAQVGKLVRVNASYIDGHGTAETKASPATTAIANVNDAATGAVTVTGTATQNRTLTAANTLADLDGLGAIGYQWQSSADSGVTWNNIGGATASTFTLTEAQVGKLVRVTASYIDGHGTAESIASAASAAIAPVSPGNHAPVVGTPLADQTAIEDFAFSFTFPLSAFNDPDSGDTLSYTASALDGSPLPAWLAFNAGSRTFSGIPSPTSSGPASLRVTATDSGGLSVSNAFVLDVLNHLAGTSSGEAIAGTAGNDYIEGLAGSDTIDGSNGNDVIVGGSSSDTLKGGAGDDVFKVAGTGDGYDTFQGDAGFDAILGSAGDDLIGMATFSGALTVERIDGGGGINGIRGDGYDNVLDFSATELLNIASIDGGVGYDRITGSAGNDVIIGGSSSDTLKGGAGDDVFKVAGSGDGYDTFQGDAGFDTILGSAGDDLIGMTTFSGASTVERIDGGGGINGIRGDSYDNVLDFSATELLNIASIDGGVGYDRITGSAGNDVIVGGSSSDTLKGGAGDDVFKVAGTGDGYDTFQGDAGFDAIVGGAGDDLIGMTTFSGASTVERIDGGGGINGIRGDGYDNVLDFSATELLNIASIDGGVGYDRITGSAGNDVIIGGSSSDTLEGGAGDDVFKVAGTGDGYDSFQGDAGFDTILGSPGDDLIGMTAFSGASTVERIDGGGGINGIRGDGYSNVLDFSATELLNIASIDGGAGDDRITGSARNDTIVGGTGTDRLMGGAGNDTYRMGRGYGADVLAENDVTAGNTDVAEFLAGIAADQVWLRHVGNNLEASLIGTTDKLTMENWYLGPAYRVEQFKTADNRLLLDSRVELLVQAMAAFAPPAAGQTTLPPSYQDSLAPVIAANWQ